MATEQHSEQLLQELHSTIVKEEPPEEEPECSSTCYGTVIKKEVILGDQEKYADQQESSSEPPTEVSSELSYKCPECNRTFDHVYKLNKCLRMHNAIRNELFKCKFCGKCFGQKRGVVRHEPTHTVGRKKRQADIVIETDQNGHFKCAGCDRTHKERKAAVKCTQRHLAKRMGLYRCKLCNLTTASAQELHRHELRHKENKRVRPPKPTDEDPTKEAKKVDCKICGKRLCNEKSLKRHEFLMHRKNTTSHKVTSEEETEHAADNEQMPRPDERSSSFCFETVMKEELIIEDEAFGESMQAEQEEDHLSSLGEGQPTENGTGSQQEGDSSESVEEQGTATKQITCNVCGMTFDKRYNLQIHNKTHSRNEINMLYEELLVQDKDSKNYTCLFCENTYSSRNRTAFVHVQRHINVIDGIYQCKICGLRSAANFLHQSHIKTHSKKSVYLSAVPRNLACGLTEYESSSDGPCEKSDRPLHCKTCDVFFNSTTNLNVHLWKSKLRIIRIKVDAATAATKKQSGTQVKPTIIRYDRSKPPTDKNGFFCCPMCDYKTKKKQAFREHCRNHEKLELGQFTCDVCQKRFTGRSHLADHKLTHAKGRVSKCSKCQEQFSSRAELFRHRVVHTKNVLSKQFSEKVTEDEKGVFTCTICGKTFVSRYAAFRHFRIHAVDKYVCDICQKRCRSNYSLKTHKESHEKQRFTCHTCEEKFDSRAAIARHRQTHISTVRVFLGNDDIYHCTRCDGTFETRQIAIRHYRTHLSAKKNHGAEKEDREESESIPKREAKDKET